MLHQEAYLYGFLIVCICVFVVSAVAEVGLKDIEVDESLFQDLEDLELEGQG